MRYTMTTIRCRRIEFNFSGRVNEIFIGAKVEVVRLVERREGEAEVVRVPQDG